MGLGMYAYKTKQEIPDVEFEHPKDAIQFFYWRKQPNVHGWMERLFVSKGGIELFHCEFVKIGSKDLDALEEAVRGFFLGESRAEHKSDDLAFIDLARAAIAEGYIVYSASWR